jgi:ubiquinone/menaquinone biosynthesis C-methylase UbiE
MSALTQEISQYWDHHIHDLAIARHPVGTKEFFTELDEYRFDKLRYLPQVVDFGAYRGKKILEIGCGVGIDLVRFAKTGAQVTGIDLSQTAIDLAGKNFGQNALNGSLQVMDGESLEYPDASFDVVYAHGVLQYTGDPEKMVREAFRVLKKGGEGIFMVYNRVSWLNLMSQITKVDLEHEDAPVLRKYSIVEFKQLLQPFESVRIVVERFPVKSRLHGGLKGMLYNTLFVGTFNVLPKCVVRPFGWHIMAFATK